MGDLHFFVLENSDTAERVVFDQVGELSDAEIAQLREHLAGEAWGGINGNFRVKCVSQAECLQTGRMQLLLSLRRLWNDFQTTTVYDGGKVCVGLSLDTARLHEKSRLAVKHLLEIREFVGSPKSDNRARSLAVSWDEAIEEDELHYLSRGLDVVLPMAGALREYNNKFAGRELLFFDNDNDPSITALTDFLNKFVRFPRDFIGGLAGAEFCSQSAFESSFGSWYCGVYAGFKFEDAERAIASAFGLAQVTTLSALLGDQHSSIEFQCADQCTNDGIVVLRAKLKTAARSEPLDIPLYLDVERFKPIDEVPLLKAIHSLTDGLLEGIDRISPTDRPSEPLPSEDITTDKISTFDFTGATEFGPKIEKFYFLPTDKSEIQQAREGKAKSSQTLYRLQSGDWVLVSVEDAFSAPGVKKVESLSPERAAKWLSENLYYSNEKLIVTFAELAKTPRAVAAQQSEPRLIWKKDLGELMLDGAVVRTVRSAKVAKGIVTILDAFQESNWATRVAPKFNGDEQRREAIRSLNNSLTGLIFEADGNDGIRWRIPS